jgi:serine/threonine protein kinase
MSDNYSDIVHKLLGVEPEFRGVWAVFGHTTLEHGWKIHISSIPTEVKKLLAIVVPLLRESGASFKITADESALRLLNEGALGATQIGKFMTIYPSSDEDSHHLAEKLIEITRGFRGPAVVTDRQLGDVVYTRYGGFNPLIIRDRFGQVMRYISNPDGSLRKDSYSVPFVAPDGVQNPFSDIVSPATDFRVAAEKNRLFGPGFLFIEMLKSNPKGSVFLALDLRSRDQVGLKVIKEGRKHCLSDQFGRDMRSRLQHQEALHRTLHSTVPVPVTGSYFEVAGNGYLPMQYIESSGLGFSENRSFGSLSAGERRTILLQLINTVTAVEALHSAGYIHRDLTVSNIRVSNDESIFLLDLELAYEVSGKESPFSHGTPGFMSPQQAAGETPHFADDIYALGCVMAAVLSHLDPRRVLFAREQQRVQQLLYLTGAPKELCILIAQCLGHSRDSRPSLVAVRGTLEHLVSRGFAALPSNQSSSDKNVRDQAKRFLSGATRGLLDNVLVNEHGLWVSPAISSGAEINVRSVSDYVLYRSTSRGVAGVIYVLARLSRLGAELETCRQRVEYAIDWLLGHNPTQDYQLPGLHFGEAGVALAIAEASFTGLIESGPWLDSYLSGALAGPLDWPDVTHGAAGQGIAVLACADLLGQDNLLDLSHRCAEYLISSQDTDGGWSLPAGVDGLEGTRYTGFAHGVAGITYFLAEYSQRFQDVNAERAWRAGAEWLIQRAQATDSGGLQWPMKDGGVECWEWWCHGAPGIALTFLKLFEVSVEARYAQIARKALETHPVDFRFSNLSQCHGLSGLGEMYLEAAQVLGEDEWYQRAFHVGRVLLQLARETKAGEVTWLVEDPNNPTGDLMVGSGGVAHFLLRLSSPHSGLSYPLLPCSARRRGTVSSVALSSM